MKVAPRGKEGGGDDCLEETSSTCAGLSYEDVHWPAVQQQSLEAPAPASGSGGLCPWPQLDRRPHVADKWTITGSVRCTDPTFPHKKQHYADVGGPLRRGPETGARGRRPSAGGRVWVASALPCSPAFPRLPTIGVCHRVPHTLCTVVFDVLASAHTCCLISPASEPAQHFLRSSKSVGFNQELW